MKRLSYLILALLSIPIVSFSSNPRSLTKEPELGYVGRSIAYSEEELDDQLIEDIINNPNEEEDFQELTLVENETPTIEDERTQLKKWKSKLPTKYKQLVRKIIKRRKRKQPQAPKLTQEKVEKLLKKALSKQGENWDDIKRKLKEEEDKKTHG